MGIRLCFILLGILPGGESGLWARAARTAVVPGIVTHDVRVKARVCPRSEAHAEPRGSLTSTFLNFASQQPFVGDLGKAREALACLWSAPHPRHSGEFPFTEVGKLIP